MKRHKKILGIVFFVLGALFSFITLGTLFQNIGEVTSSDMIFVLLQAVMGIAFFLSSFGGFFLLRDKEWAYNICHNASFVWLLYIPIGTVFGAYYIWFHDTYVKRGVK